MSSIELITRPEGNAMQEIPSLLLALLRSTHNNEVETLQSILPQLPQTVEQLECFASKADLRRFTQWALQQSYSPALTLDEKMQLLDAAWKIQELLWAGYSC